MSKSVFRASKAALKRAAYQGEREVIERAVERLA